MSREKLPQRPSSGDIQAKAQNMKENLAPQLLQGALIEIADMARGRNIEGVREQFYPGWEDEDFQALLELLEASN